MLVMDDEQIDQFERENPFHAIQNDPMISQVFKDPLFPAPSPVQNLLWNGIDADDAREPNGPQQRTVTSYKHIPYERPSRRKHRPTVR